MKTTPRILAMLAIAASMLTFASCDEGTKDDGSGNGKDSEQDSGIIDPKVSIEGTWEIFYEEIYSKTNNGENTITKDYTDPNLADEKYTYTFNSDNTVVQQYLNIDLDSEYEWELEETTLTMSNEDNSLFSEYTITTLTEEDLIYYSEVIRDDPEDYYESKLTFHYKRVTEE